MIKSGVNKSLRALGYEILKKHDCETSIARLFSKLNVGFVLDIGANHGESIALWRKLFPNALIHGFEPVEMNYARLSERFNGDKHVRLHKLALGKSEGSCQINLSAGASTHSFRSRGSNPKYGPPRPDLGTSEVVEMTTIDKWIKASSLQKVDLCKIDVEGLETDVLDGAKECLGAAKISVVMIELMFVEIYEGQGLFYDICREMSHYGYGIYDLPYIRRHRDGQIRWGDAIFISDPFRASNPLLA